jgi:hypothetical protein
VHKGELVGERYAPGFGPFIQQRSWSTAKSFTASIIGLLVDRGKLHLDRRPPYLREWKNDERRAITLRNLLNMSSGLKQNQYEGTANSLMTFTPESEHAFIYFDGFDTYKDALEAPLEVPPESRWQYRNANVLSAAASAKRVLAHAGKNFSVWAQRHLLEPLGMRTTTLETDPYGQFIASGTAFTTARHERYGVTRKSVRRRPRIRSAFPIWREVMKKFVPSAITTDSGSVCRRWRRRRANSPPWGLRPHFASTSKPRWARGRAAPIITESPIASGATPSGAPRPEICAWPQVALAGATPNARLAASTASDSGASPRSAPRPERRGRRMRRAPCCRPGRSIPSAR